MTILYALTTVTAENFKELCDSEPENDFGVGNRMVAYGPHKDKFILSSGKKTTIPLRTILLVNEKTGFRESYVGIEELGTALRELVQIGDKGISFIDANELLSLLHWKSVDRYRERLESLKTESSYIEKTRDKMAEMRNKIISED